MVNQSKWTTWPLVYEQNCKKSLIYPLQCYQPKELLCDISPILETLIYARAEPIIDPLLPKEQAGFPHGRSTVGWVTLLTQDIEDSFSAKKAGSAFAAICCDCCLIDTWSERPWRWLAIEASPIPPEMAKGADRDASKTAFTRDRSVLAPLHFNIYISDTTNHRFRKECICWRSNIHPCWWRLAGSGRGA